MNAVWQGDRKVTTGPWVRVVAYRAICPDGRARVTARVGASPDTFCSHAASMRVDGVTVRGVVTLDDDGAPRFVPLLASRRPTWWAYDLDALERAHAAAWQQARGNVHEARARRWHPCPNGDASARNRARCARLVRDWLRIARIERDDARTFGRALDVAHAHEVARWTRGRTLWDAALHACADVAYRALLAAGCGHVSVTVTDASVRVWTSDRLRLVSALPRHAVGPVQRDASGPYCQIAPRVA